MRSLILALAVAAMVVSSGCCLNDSSCNSCDGCLEGWPGEVAVANLVTVDFWEAGVNV